MKLGDALMRHGESKVVLGIAQTGRVQVHVYDVAGRKVRMLADRVFPAGEQTLVWDGTDDGGRKVARGVYFVRSSTQERCGADRGAQQLGGGGVRPTAQTGALEDDATHRTLDQPGRPGTRLATAAHAQLEGTGRRPGPAQRADGEAADGQPRESAGHTSAGADPDSVYIGKSATNHTAPDNYWELYVGKYLPGNQRRGAMRCGTGYNSVGSRPRDRCTAGGRCTPVQLDRRPHADGRPTDWWALDHGNMATTSSAARGRQAHVRRGRYWHGDRNPGGPANGVRGVRICGTRSAWCGLRSTRTDRWTRHGQPFNQESSSSCTTLRRTVSNNNFPGYPDQIDQMLFRDIPMLTSQSLSVTFNYRTRMSTSIGTAAATRTGWFHGDPLAVTAGNFISSSAAGANAPQDSFMVYVGAPVNDAAVCTRTASRVRCTTSSAAGSRK
jgi:hypothetical protein